MTLPPIASFLLEIDALKLIERRSYIAGGRRLENSGEHSWHVAMAAWALGRCLSWDVALEKVLKLALIHDLGELDAGDTFLYSNTRQAGVEAERACIARLGRAHAALIPELPALWDEQERGDTAESRLVRIADRFLPFLHNIASQGRTWQEHDIAKSQVLDAHRFIADAAPDLFAWMQSQLDDAVKNGWLKDA